MNKEKFTAFMTDAAAVAELKNCASLEDLVACMNKHGVECTMEEGAACLQAMQDIAAGGSEAMDLDAMDAVAGGGFFSAIGDFFSDLFNPSSLTDFMTPSPLFDDSPVEPVSPFNQDIITLSDEIYRRVQSGDTEGIISVEGGGIGTSRMPSALDGPFSSGIVK